MENPVLQAENRTQLGTRAVRRLRKEGKVPAILYGHKEDSLPLSIAEKSFETALHTGARMFRIKWDNNEQDALLKETQYDIFGNKILHADFIRVAMDEKVTVEVAVELRGTPVGTTKGGVLEQVLRAVDVECLPAAIPDKLVLDVSGLDVGGHLTLKNLALPPGVKVMHDDPDAVVAQVRLPVVKEEAAPSEEEEMAKEPEVITKKAREKEEEEGES